MTSNGNSEAATENDDVNTYRELLKDMGDRELRIVVQQGNPAPSAAALMILSDRERASKPKRGRPMTWTNVELETLAQDWEIPSRRTMQNRMYGEAADRILRNSGRSWDWRYLGSGVLAELGRFEDEADVLACAEAICKLKPKTKDAIARLRRARLDKAPPADALSLSNKLICVINEYLTAHPDTTKTDVRNALFTAGHAVQESLSEAATKNGS